MTEPRPNGRDQDNTIPAHSRTARAKPDTPGPTVVVCNGPACTTSTHNPDDTVRRLGPAIAASSGGILIRSLACLGACPYAPVAIVNQREAAGCKPSTCHPSAQHAGGLTVWINIEAPSTVARIARWVQAGGPGVAPMPADLDENIITIQ